MKFHEPSRTALVVAGQRAAHQLLDHGAILDDPYALRILGEHADTVLQVLKTHPLAKQRAPAHRRTEPYRGRWTVKSCRARSAAGRDSRRRAPHFRAAQSACGSHTNL